ncbi:hypothetical protein B0H67DRAFT_594942 [Lasiosphaeris hirsuta]|uniref:Uncharacterized protein n=1 Tax=Lasiosphaeris hirsuta TaxID=260670 RepID=A0AA39ZS91_9PEZI|nr:hypothetical protein B0H67DRAFT_594942 [Lasiosphaeris hirsuta]
MDDSDEPDAASRQRPSSSNEAPFTTSSVSWSSGTFTNSGPLPTSRREQRPPFQTLNATTQLATVDTVLSDSSTLPAFRGWNSTGATSQVTSVVASATYHHAIHCDQFRCRKNGGPSLAGVNYHHGINR